MSLLAGFLAGLSVGAFAGIVLVVLAVSGVKQYPQGRIVERKS
jgi:hypothetical protein